MQLQGRRNARRPGDGHSLCIVRRAADWQDESITLKPTQEAGGLATIGISSPATVTLYRKPGRARPVPPAAERKLRWADGKAESEG